ncbi:hypothetical protein H5P28_17840 [Ruficoccus amylovorans]|uniref:Uncharacterized protein n=1 Tax=Ruficoccus amylovorans TaxID=1804625 RepID=A0A842HKD3_9BACT|nr:hypothetical protein [Ruficoccus amylovorans]MBC2596134.1 hypothetical protein [Ruficoccus amylovorans]
MNVDEFKALLESTLDAKFAQIMSDKPAKERFLRYVDGITLTTAVRNIFKHKLKVTPPQVEAACKLSEAVLAPSGRERENLIKAAVGVGGGAAGIAMVIGGIGAALGWGAGAVAATTAFFMGSSIAGPVGWISTGIAIAAVAGYFVLTGSPQKDTERFMRVPKNSVNQAVEAIWPQYGEALSDS